MRSTFDRIRQAVLFELGGLFIATPLASAIMGQPMTKTGSFVIATSVVATCWNYLYNLGFDHLLRWTTGTTQKRVWHRIVHAIGFETALIAALWPLAKVWMGIGWGPAFGLVAGLAVFYIVYALVFTWAYDMVFPDPDSAGSGT